MAKQNTDRTTIDLFASEKRVGRPRTNPLERKDQLKANKRNQLKRDRANGLKRIELKVEQHLFEKLNQLADESGISRSELIEKILNSQFSINQQFVIQVKNMASVGIFFGSDTGNTEAVAQMIQKELGKKLVEVKDIAKSTKEDIDEFSLILLGIPTWYYGEAQCDWDDFFPDLEQIDFSEKLVAIFGCGDQEDYAEYFLDAMGTINDIVVNKGATVVGHWPIESYDFEESKALADDKHFVGLGIDEDRQPELTQERVKAWCQQVYQEMCLAELED